MVESRGFDGGGSTSSDDNRCVRNDGKKWRCSAPKFLTHNYCEKHFKQKELKKHKGKFKAQKFPKEKPDKGKGVVTKEPKRKGVDAILSLSPEKDEEEEEEEEEEEVPLIRKKRKTLCNDEDNALTRPRPRSGYKLLSDDDDDDDEEELEEVQVQPAFTKTLAKYHTEVFSIKKSEECSISELILSLRACFGQTDFEKVVMILKGREDKLKMEKEEAEKKAVCCKRELEICEENCNKLLNDVEERRDKEVGDVGSKVKELERNKGVIEDRVRELERNRVVVEEDLRKYMKMCIELKTRNRELESEKARAENEVGVWKKRFQELATKVSSTVGSCTEEGKKNVGRQMRTEGGSDCVLVHGGLSNVKVKEEALEFNAKVNASAIVDSSCRSMAKEGGIGQRAESGVKDGSVVGEKKAFQLEGSFYKTPTSPKIEQRSITMEQMASQIHLKGCSAQKKNGGEKGSSSDQILASTTEKKWIREEGSSDSKSCEIHTVLTQPENSKHSLTSPQQKPVSPQNLTEKRNGAVGTSSEHLVIHEADNGKEVKESGSNCGAGVDSSIPNAKPEGMDDGISKFLHELRKLKASNPNWKGILL